MSDLIWSVIRKNNAFKVGSRHETATFSTEAGNLTGRHSSRASGFTHAVAVDVTPLVSKRKGAYGATVRVKTTAGVENKPAKQWTNYRTKGTDFAQRKTAAALAKSAGRDKTLQKLVQLRVAKVLRASYRKKLARGTGHAVKRNLKLSKK